MKEKIKETNGYAITLAIIMVVMKIVRFFKNEP